MDSENLNSSSLSEDLSETIISDVQYIALDEIISTEDDEPPQKDRFVRLMSLDSNEMNRSSSSTVFEDEYPDTCPQYWDIISLAEKFVNDIIGEAEGLINKHVRKIPMSKTVSKERTVRKFSGEYPVIEYNRPEFTGWPVIGDFTIELGADKIDEYLASFNSNEDWLYIIYYLGVKNDYPSKYYEYQAMWSLPSPEYPVAQATASVFFTIEISEVLPLDCLVTVTFTFESHQFKHKPGLTDFCEEFLNYILDSKIGVFKKIRF